MEFSNNLDQSHSKKSDPSKDSVFFALPVAVVIGLDLLGRAVAITAAIFAGALAAGQATGLTLILFASLVGVVVSRAARGIPPSILLTAQQAPIAALLPAIGTLAALGMASGTMIATALAIIGLTTVLTGGVLLFLARFDLGRLVRFLPYPVSTGFLAATGALLCFFAVKSVMSAGLTGPFLGLPTVGLTLAAAGFFAIAHRFGGETGVALGLGAALALFHAALIWMGIDLATAQLWGLVHPMSDATGEIFLLPAVLMQVDVSALLDVLPTILVAVLIAIIANYLSIGAIEVGTNYDLTGRKAGRMTGFANIVAGSLGGPVVFSSPSSSISAHIMHGNHPLMPIFLGIFIVASMIFSQEIMGLVPGFLSGGLLFFLGGRIIWLWLVLPARTMTIFDSLVSGLIVAVSLVAGMLPAIMLGGVIAVIFFAVTYSKLPVIRRKGGLAQWRSNVDRSGPESAVLDGHADRVAVLQADGFLFFGSVDQLTEGLLAELGPNLAPRCVILDCGRVSGADATACSSIVRIATRAAQWNHRIFVAGGPDSLQNGLVQQMAVAQSAGLLFLFPNLDQALERAEDELVAAARGPTSNALAALRHLAGDSAPSIAAQMTRMTLAAGQKLITAGEFSRDIFVLDQGRLGIYVGSSSAAPLRLRIVRPGAIVGEMASYLNGQRTADVIAEEPCEFLVMRAEALESLRRTSPETVAAWHRVMAQALAEKLMRTTRALAEQK